MADGRLMLMLVALILYLPDVIAKIDKNAPLFPSFQEMKEMVGDEKDVQLWITGLYIAAFKYFGVGKNGPYFKQFPKKVWPNMDKNLAGKCKSSAEDCVKAVYTVAKKSDSLQPLMKENGTFVYLGNLVRSGIYKYKDKIAKINDDPNFRMTAMYYLCWHAVMGDAYLKFSNSSISCLEKLHLVGEVTEKNQYDVKNQIYLTQKSFPRLVDDVRDIAFMQRDNPFLCARLWFCPDPCYGRESGGVFDDKQFHGKVAGNPCEKFPSATCDWKKGANDDFDNLIKNNFNITCNCESYKAGYVWSTEKKDCISSNGCKKGEKWDPQLGKCKDKTKFEYVKLGSEKKTTTELNSQPLDEKEIDDAAMAIAMMNKGDSDVDYDILSTGTSIHRG